MLSLGAFATNVSISGIEDFPESRREEALFNAQTAHNMLLSFLFHDVAPFEHVIRHRRCAMS